MYITNRFLGFRMAVGTCIASPANGKSRNIFLGFGLGLLVRTSKKAAFVQDVSVRDVMTMTKLSGRRDQEELLVHLAKSIAVMKHNSNFTKCHFRAGPPLTYRDWKIMLSRMKQFQTVKQARFV